MEIIEDFGINPLLLGAQIVNFVILLFILKRFLYKPVMKVLDERKQKVEASLKQAEEIQASFDQIEKKQAEALQKARSEASQIIAEAKQEAKAISEGMRKDAADAATETVKRTQEMLVLEKDKMMSQAKSELVDMIAIATEKVAQKSLKGDEKEKIINEALKEIKK